MKNSDQFSLINFKNSSPLEYSSNFQTDIKSLDMFTAVVFASSLMCFSRNRNLFDYIIIYEDLLENPMAETEELFQTFSIPTKHIPNVLTALKKDSQGKFFGNTSGKKTQVFSPKQWQKIENIFKQLKVPISQIMTLNEFRTLVNLNSLTRLPPMLKSHVLSANLNKSTHG